MSKIPKDREIIIITAAGNHVAIWSPTDKKFVYANIQIDLFEGKWDMYYYETEYIEEDYVLGWREL